MNKKLPIRRLSTPGSVSETDSLISKAVIQSHTAPSAPAAPVIVELGDSSNDEEEDTGTAVAKAVVANTANSNSDDELEEDFITEKCLFCGLSLRTLTDAAEREEHVTNCVHRGVGSYRASQSQATGTTPIINRQKNTYSSATTNATDHVNGHSNNKFTDNHSQFGLLESKFYCVVCDLDMSRRCLLSRCRHLKRCAKNHYVGTRELLMRMGTSNEEEEEDRDEEDNANVGGGSANNMATVPGSGGVLASGTPAGSACRTTGIATKVVVLDDSSDEKDEEGMGEGGFGMPMPEQAVVATAATATILSVNATGSSGFSGSSSVSGLVKAVASTTQNAFSHLMSSAKLMYTKPSVPMAVNISNNHNSSTSNNINNNNNNNSNLYPTEEPPRYSGSCPSFKKIAAVHPVTKRVSNIIVDGFQYACRTLSDCYFLTHFHSDHTIGLTKSFSAGRIYCSATTAALVRLKLKLKNGPNVSIIPLQLERTYTIYVGDCGAMYTDGTGAGGGASSSPLVPVEVICMDANHCPGAIVILFTFLNGKRVLHTGDFRWCQQQLNCSPTYRSLKFTAPPRTSGSAGQIARNLTVYLDTTYCDPVNSFPPQHEMIDMVTECVLADANAQILEGKDPRINTLYVFGAYSIGKERVYMSAAHALGCRVYMDKTRWRTCLCYDEWGETEHNAITTDEQATNVHVAWMNQVNFNHLAGLRQNRPGCTRVVAFSPTGWTFGGGGGGGGWGRKPAAAAGGPAGKKRKADGSTASASIGSVPCSVDATVATNTFTLKPRTNGTDLIYPVPYSEHSSFSELASFMDTFRPNVVIPTVNTSDAAVKRQIQFLKDANPHIYGGGGGGGGVGSDSSVMSVGDLDALNLPIGSSVQQQARPVSEFF